MTNMDHAFYDLKFDALFSSKKANEFQQFFSQIMSAHYPGDFFTTRTWGQTGDMKCDGYILSTGTFFQVYAPDELKAEATIKKMTEDLYGALEKWGDKIKEWVFVHNAKQGIPSFIVNQIAEFLKKNPLVVFLQMGKPELKSVLFELNDRNISDILGSIPTYADINGLSMEAIKQTMFAITSPPSLIDATIEPVSQEKLNANGLSNDSKQLFEVGMMKSKLVEDFFRSWYDPNLEGITAAEMSSLYKAAVSECLMRFFRRYLTQLVGERLETQLKQ